MRVVVKIEKNAGASVGPTISLCGCLVHVPVDRLRQFLRHPEVNLVEWRLDSFIKFTSLAETMDSLPLLSTSARHPVVATNRPIKEGGAFDGSEAERIEVLQKAIEAGAEWVDIEASAGCAALAAVRSGRARILLSHHDFSGTADRLSLRRLVTKMADKQPDVIKIICYAKAPEDNLRMLELIPFCRREFGIGAIAFCMGPVGGWSRLVCLSLGSPWTYVQFTGLTPSAPGQYTAEEMRHLLDQGRWLQPAATEPPMNR